MSKKINKNNRDKRLYIYNRDNGTCQICNQTVTFNKMVLDHIIPKSIGGTNRPFNLQVTHSMCNELKANFDGEFKIVKIPRDKSGVNSILEMEGL